MSAWLKSILSVPTEIGVLKTRLDNIERRLDKLTDETIELMKQGSPSRGRRKPKGTDNQ